MDKIEIVDAEENDVDLLLDMKLDIILNNEETLKIKYKWQALKLCPKCLLYQLFRLNEYKPHTQYRLNL